MWRRVGVIVLACGWCLLADTEAFGWFVRRQATVGYSYPPTVALVPLFQPVSLTPIPVYLAPAPPVCAAAVQPAPAAAPTYAPPQQAPPSPAAPAENPAPSGPAAGESGSFFDTYAVAPRASDVSSGERCRVGFWNLSGQDLILNVEGQPQSLARGQHVQLELVRQFVWQVDGRLAQTQSLPPSQSALNIVIRR